MAVQLIESFDWTLQAADLVGPGKWSSWNAGSGTPGSIVNGGGRTGNCLLVIVGDSELGKTFGVADDGWVFGFAFQMENLTAQTPNFIHFLNSEGLQLFLRLNANDEIEVRRADNTILGTSLVVLSAGVWYYLEFKFTIHNSTGSFELRLDGTTVASGSNVDTQQQATATVDRILLESFGGQNLRFDDFYALTQDATAPNDFLGDQSVVYRAPSGAGATTGLTPTGAATNWEAVDEVDPDDDTSYVAGETGKDTYAAADVPTDLSAVIAVGVINRARKDDAGARTVAPVVRSGGVDYAGTAQALSTSWQTFQHLWPLNPDGDVAWTPTTVNAIEVGTEVA